MKALELADKLDSRVFACWGTHAAIAKPYVKDAAAELRRLAEVNAELLVALITEYYALSDVHNNWQGRDTIQGQQRMCRLRDLIASATGLTSEQVQNGEAKEQQ